MRRRRARPGQWARATDGASVTQVARDYVDRSTTYVLGPGSLPVRPALAGLPPAPEELHGRAPQVRELLALLDPGTGGPRTAPVAVVTGLPGVGKTALIGHVAQQAYRREWFPGGAVFLDLRGHASGEAVTAEEAVAAVLLRSGIRAEGTDEEHRRAQLRSLFAERAAEGQRMLIVADDPADASVLEPLVPTDGSHRLLVASRTVPVPSVLAAPPPLHLLPLDELPPAASGELIAAALRDARAGEERPAREADALARITEQCGHLPLALRIVAAQLTADPGLRLSTMAETLDDARTRLEKLRFDEGGGRSLAVRAAFDLSYERLPGGDAETFRLLSLHPGREVSTEAAAALAGRTAEFARTALARLSRAGLLQEDGDGGRWRMHDLLRLHAAEQAGRQTAEADREAALDRLFAFCTAALAAAQSHVLEREAGPASERFADRGAALSWIDAEYDTLHRLQGLAARTGRHRVVAALAQGLGRYRDQRFLFREVTSGKEETLAAFRALGDRDGEADELNRIASAYAAADDLDRATEYYEQAHEAYAALGQDHAMAGIRHNLGKAQAEAGVFGEAEENLRFAADHWRRTGQARAAAMALNNLGRLCVRTGRHDEAERMQKAALVLHRREGDRYGQVRTLENIGHVHHARKEFSSAVAHFELALAVSAGTDGRLEPGVLMSLGRTYESAGRRKDAVASYRRAVLSERLEGSRYGEALAWDHLVNLHLEYSRPDLQKAREYALRAARLYREAGHPAQEASALESAGIAARSLESLGPETSRPRLVLAGLGLVPFAGFSAAALERVIGVGAWAVTVVLGLLAGAALPHRTSPGLVPVTLPWAVPAGCAGTAAVCGVLAWAWPGGRTALLVAVVLLTAVGYLLGAPRVIHRTPPGAAPDGVPSPGAPPDG